MHVIVYDPPDSVDELNTAVYDGDIPVDIALDVAARVGAAAELRRLADEVHHEGAFAVAVGKLRARADYLDPDGATATTNQGGQQQ
jgi:hypothetical protein